MSNKNEREEAIEKLQERREEERERLEKKSVDSARCSTPT